MIHKVDRMYEMGEKRRKFSYNDIPHSVLDWVDVSIYLPADFDLVELKLSDEKIIRGWHTGHHWDGLRLKHGQEIKFWRMEE